MNSSTAAGHENNVFCRLTKDFEILRQTPLFTGLHLDVVKLFAYLSIRRTFHPGDLLIEQGEKADRAFILINGNIEVSVVHRGKEALLQLLQDDDFFGELALLAQFDWFFTVKALTDADVLIIDRTAFQKVIEKFPNHKDMLIERVVQLRVDRLAEQTSFMLDKLLLSNDGPATTLI